MSSGQGSSFEDHPSRGICYGLFGTAVACEAGSRYPMTSISLPQKSHEFFCPTIVAKAKSEWMFRLQIEGEDQVQKFLLWYAITELRQ